MRMRCKMCGEETIVLTRYKPLPNFRYTVYYCEKCDMRWGVLENYE
jgi:hypothetical protein